MRVLVVDDSRVMRLMVRGALEKMEPAAAEVFEASDGLEALRRLEEERLGVDVILADWNMPKMDGITFVRLIREREALKRIPVIMLTSQSQKSQKDEAARIGVSQYLMKPFDADVLRRTVLEVAAPPPGAASAS